MQGELPQSSLRDASPLGDGATAGALAMFSGKNLFAFVVQKRLRAFLNHFFTRGVWERTSPVTYGDIFP